LSNDFGEAEPNEFEKDVRLGWNVASQDPKDVEDLRSKINTTMYLSMIALALEWINKPDTMVFYWLEKNKGLRKFAKSRKALTIVDIVAPLACFD
jgi:hypothetical protein